MENDGTSMNTDDVKKRVIGRTCLFGFGMFVQGLRVPGVVRKAKEGEQTV